MFQRRFFSLFILIFLAFQVSAQKTDQVSLKNGSVIRGSVEKIVPDESVTINDQAGNTWVFQMAEVEKIEKVETGYAHALEKKPNQQETIIPVKTGLVNMTTIGFLPGSQGTQYRAPFSVQSSLGYMSNFGLYTGIMAGLEFFNITHIPLMMDLQYNLRSGEIRPVLIARGGYALPTKWNSEYYGTQYSYSGGITGAIGMGLKIHSKEDFAWDVSLLYRYLEINYVEEYEWQNYPNTYKDVYNRLEIRIGFYLGL